VGLIMAFAVGYFVGARGGNEGYDEVISAIRAVAKSEEAEDLVRALRSHASQTLQELGRRISSDVDEPLSMSSILDRTRHLIQKRATETAS
jgi:hypothetical protein